MTDQCPLLYSCDRFNGATEHRYTTVILWDSHSTTHTGTCRPPTDRFQSPLPCQRRPAASGRWPPHRIERDNIPQCNENSIGRRAVWSSDGGWYPGWRRPIGWTSDRYDGNQAECTPNWAERDWLGQPGGCTRAFRRLNVHHSRQLRYSIASPTRSSRHRYRIIRTFGSLISFVHAWTSDGRKWQTGRQARQQRGASLRQDNA